VGRTERIGNRIEERGNRIEERDKGKKIRKWEGRREQEIE
jgi:hypothetical protein